VVQFGEKRQSTCYSNLHHYPKAHCVDLLAHLIYLDYSFPRLIATFTQSFSKKMDRKRLLIYGGITVVLAALVYLQFRTWKNFDWPIFWTEWKHISPTCILAAVAFIYVSYYLRALRWKIFLR